MMSTKDPILTIKKMNKLKILPKALLLAFVIVLQSCDHVIDQIHENEQEQNYISPYRGNYTGTYTGDLNGNIVIKVSDKGSVEITRIAVNAQESYMTGLINSSFSTTNKAPSGFILLGNLESKAGTWEMGNLKGTWNVTKN